MFKHAPQLLVSIIIGSAIALLFRFGGIAIATDFSYIKIFGYESVDINAGTKNPLSDLIGWKYDGKAIFNVPIYGFPFPPYVDCQIRALGMVTFTPRCERRSWLGEFATLFNLIFWSGLCYGGCMIYKKYIKR